MALRAAIISLDTSTFRAKSKGRDVRRVTLVVTAVGTDAPSTIVALDPSEWSSNDAFEVGDIRLDVVVTDDRAKEIIDSLLDSDSRTESFEQAMETLVEREIELAELNGKLFECLTSAFERTLIRCVYESTQRVQSRTAEHLGINRNTLHKKLCKYNLLSANPKKAPSERGPESPV